MKSFNRFSVMAAIVGTLTLAGCADDVYDPERGIQTDPVENPLGEDFSAPDGFNWSMINVVNLNVEVKDEFNGQYQYLIEVFTVNPLADTGATPIAAGVANKNKSYTAEINVPKTAIKLFIRQTDPKQRTKIHEFKIPQDSCTLNCKLYYVATGTRALTYTSEAPGKSGWENVTSLAYKEETYNVPSQSAQISGNQLAPGSVYVIKAGETYSGVLHSYNGANATVYVQGTWNLAGGAAPQGIDIIVLSGGKIIATSGNFMVSDKSSLTIQKGGIVSCESFKTATDVIIKNFGTFSTQQIKNFNTGTIVYNAEGATFSIIGGIPSMTHTQVHNRGEFNVGGIINTNNSPRDVIIANYETGIIKANKLNGGATIINDNIIEVDTYDCDTATESWLYNNCTFIAKTTFKCGNVMLDHGSIIGGKENNKFLAVNKIETLDANGSKNQGNFILKNGSMAKALQIVCGSSTKFTGDGSSISMLQAESITYNWTTHLKGNLVLAVTTEINGDNPNTDYFDGRYEKDSSVEMTTLNGSAHIIDNCAGIIYEGNTGGTPGDSDSPIEVGENNVYTFAFEDNWPKYGDFDMNDLIIVMSRKELQIDKKSGTVKRLRMTLELRAVGATKKLGAGIRFTGLPQNLQPGKFTVNGNDASFEDKQSIPTYILFNDAHTALWGSEYTDTKKYINTLIDGSFKKDTKEYNIIMEIPATANVKPEDLNVNTLDIFAITAPTTTKRMRTEVHVAGFPPTDLGGTYYFGSGNDNSSVAGDNYYLSTEGLAWAVVIPLEFAWPKEWKKITTVYDKFESWVTTGGEVDNDWYDSHNEDIYPIGNLAPLNKK